MLALLQSVIAKRASATGPTTVHELACAAADFWQFFNSGEYQTKNKENNSFIFPAFLTQVTVAIFFSRFPPLRCLCNVVTASATVGSVIVVTLKHLYVPNDLSSTPSVLPDSSS